MTRGISLCWRVLVVSLLAVVLSAAADSYSAYAQGAIGQPDPTGAATGSAKDVAVKDAANPTLGEVMDTVGHNKIAINFVWTLMAGFLVMFMQAGFAMVETGFTRAKNAAHTMTMNFMIYPIGMLGFWICGYALQMGGVGAVGALGGTAPLNHEFTINLFGHTFGLFGLKGFFLSSSTYDVGVFALFLFQMVFMDTAGTIPTGAMAERWKFSAFIVFGFFMSMLVYPLYANWVWGGGWLSQLGAQFGLGHGHVDFAGSSVCTWSAAWRHSPAPSSSDRASASTPSPASRSRCPATTFPWRWPARSSWRSAGSGSIRARRWPVAICASPWSRPTPCWPAPAAPSPRCSMCGSALASRIRACSATASLPAWWRSPPHAPS